MLPAEEISPLDNIPIDSVYFVIAQVQLNNARRYQSDIYLLSSRWVEGTAL